MKKAQIEIGGTYTAKVSGKVVRVRIDGESRLGGWNATNLETNKEIRIKSPQRLRRAVTGKAAMAKAKAAKTAVNPTVEIVTGQPLPDDDRCATLGCDRPAVITHLGRPRCQQCWDAECPPDERPAAKAKAGAAAKTKADAKAAGKPKREPRLKEPKSKRVSALDAAAQVLRKADRAMASKDLITAMAEQGLWQSPNGKTPHATLYAAILREIAAKGDAARFRKVDRGQFVFNG